MHLNNLFNCYTKNAITYVISKILDSLDVKVKSSMWIGLKDSCSG